MMGQGHEVQHMVFIVCMHSGFLGVQYVGRLSSCCPEGGPDTFYEFRAPRPKHIGIHVWVATRGAKHAPRSPGPNCSILCCVLVESSKLGSRMSFAVC